MTPKSFLQTQEWLDFQAYAGRKTWRFDDGPPSPDGFGRASKIQANIIRHDLPMGKNYLYIPHGPVIFFDDIKSGLKSELANFTNYLKDLGNKNKSVFIKIEPLSDIVTELIFRRGFRRSSKNIQPHKTVVIHLNQDENELLGKMHQKTRYNINLASKKGLVLKEKENLEVFWELLKKTAQKDNFSTHSKDYYKKLLEFFKDKEDFLVKMFLVHHENPPSPDGFGRASKPIAGAVVLIYANTAYYLHGAMDRDYANMMAPYFMHWEIIKWAKGHRLMYYDLWGIDAQKWPGVTRFKLGWGGHTVEYPGSFDMPVSKFWYLVYRIARKVF